MTDAATIDRLVDVATAGVGDQDLTPHAVARVLRDAGRPVGDSIVLEVFAEMTRRSKVAPDLFPPGTRVRIAASYSVPDFWGLLCEIADQSVPAPQGRLWVKPLQDRPDNAMSGPRTIFQVHPNYLEVEPPLHDPAALEAWLNT